MSLHRPSFPTWMLLKGADNAYQLLHDALTATRKIGIARVVISNRQHLAVKAGTTDTRSRRRAERSGSLDRERGCIGPGLREKQIRKSEI
jgi:hypothetical protein